MPRSPSKSPIGSKIVKDVELQTHGQQDIRREESGSALGSVLRGYDIEEEKGSGDESQMGIRVGVETALEMDWSTNSEKTPDKHQRVQHLIRTFPLHTYALTPICMISASRSDTSTVNTTGSATAISSTGAYVKHAPFVTAISFKMLVATI